MELTYISIEVLGFLFLIAVVAGVLDTLAGGGGLICLPALIVCGVPPLAALGTNKLQGSMGTATATYMMFKSKRVNWVSIKYLMMTAFLGAVVGTITVQFFDAEALSIAIPLVLVVIALYFLLSPLLKLKQDKVRLSSGYYNNLVVPVIGCYDGFFGPGTGSFFTLAGVFCRGREIIASTAAAKPLNFATNIASLCVFLLVGQVVWVVGITMMVGQVLGAWCGSHFLFRINPNYLRGIVVLMCTVMLVKYGLSVQ